jgi:hypothetical protein
MWFGTGLASHQQRRDKKNFFILGRTLDSNQNLEMDMTEDEVNKRYKDMMIRLRAIDSSTQLRDILRASCPKIRVHFDSEDAKQTDLLQREASAKTRTEPAPLWCKATEIGLCRRLRGL